MPCSSLTSSSQWRQNPSVGDLLSSLPDHLVHHIFKFLFFHDIIRTSLLSKRFRDLWTTSPTLRFSYFDRLNVEEDVNRALLLYDSTTLQHLEIHHDALSDAACSNIIPWIRFAVRRNVQCLELFLTTSERCRPNIHSFLYNCLSLQSLGLSSFNLNQPSIHFPSLKILHVSRCTLSSVLLLIDACPRMEELAVCYCKLDDYKIDAGNHNNLRILTLSELHVGELIQVENRVEVLAPKLASLTLYGILRHGYFIAKLPLLSVARLSLGSRIPWHDSYLEDFDFDQWMKMIVAVSHVRTLELCDWSFLAIAMKEIKKEDTMILNATRLELSSGLSEWAISGISYLLKGLHRLQDLQIYIKDELNSKFLEVIGNVSSLKPNTYGFSEYKYCEPLDDILSRGLCQLRVIKLVGFPKDEKELAASVEVNKMDNYIDSVKEFWFLKCFLRNVGSLEKVVIDLCLIYLEREKPILISALSRRLLRLPRASPSVKFVFI